MKRLSITILLCLLAGVILAASVIHTPGRKRVRPPSTVDPYWHETRTFLLRYQNMGDNTNTAGNVLDDSGNGVVATNNGTVSVIVGTNSEDRVDTARVFGGDDYLDLGCPAVMSVEYTNFTWMIWFRLTNSVQANNTSGKRLMARELSDYHSTALYAYSNAALTPKRYTVEAWVSHTSPNVYAYANSSNAPMTLVDLNWHHAAMVADGAKLYLYIDGVLQSAVAWTQHMDAEAQDNTFIGATEYGGSATLFWAGELDEARFSSNALSAAEIYAYYLTNSLPTNNMVYR